MYMFLKNQWFILVIFFSVAPHQFSLQPSAILGGNPPGDRQSAVGWGDTGFEPGTAGLPSGMLQLSLHTSLVMEYYSSGTEEV